MRLHGQEGLTLTEMVIALAVIGLLIAIIAQAFSLFLTVPSRGSSQLAALHNLRQAAQWITKDGEMAQAFTPGTNPDYGTFAWLDYNTSLPDGHGTRYYFGGGSLFRQLYYNNDAPISRAIAQDIESYSDITFLSAGRFLTVTITSTVLSAMGPVREQSTFRVQMRPQLATIALPSPLPAQRGFFYVITSTGSGLISARWSITAQRTLGLFIYQGSPFGAAPSGTSSTPPGRWPR